MDRYFVIVVTYEGNLAINLLVFREARKVIEQFSTTGEYDAPCNGVNFDPETGRLGFIAEGESHCVRDLREIDQALAESLIRSPNWDNLMIGLGNRSERTLEWLGKKGIIDYAPAGIHGNARGRQTSGRPCRREL